MTVFSSVTATLTPELASCMKAKGRTWKDAFFDSLKTLVGVEHVTYKKENQWQIKGEWNAVKKAYSILAKVADIEKDAMAAYQAEGERASGGPSTGDEPSEAVTPRRRGRAGKHRGPTRDNKTEQLLPSKRKRGRPRKVKSEEIKDDSDVENGEMEKWGLENELGRGDVDTSLGEEKVENVCIPESAPSDFTIEAKTDENNAKQDLTTENTVKSSMPADNGSSGCLSEIASKEEEWQIPPLPVPKNVETQGLTLINEDNMIISQQVTIQSDAVGGREGGQEAMSQGNMQSSDDIGSRSNTVGATIPGTSILVETDAKTSHLNHDSFADVAMAVAQEAIACTSSSVQPIPEPQTLEATPLVIQQGNVPPENIETSHIYGYPGIKHKTAVDDFIDENDRFSTEQSKKLEELIEKMIEKMDKTLTDVPRGKVPPGPKYICTECPYTSRNKTELRNHMKHAHKEAEDSVIEWDNDDDPQSPASPEEVKLSDRRRLGPRRHHCFECNYTTNSRKHLKEHKLRKHQEKTLECEICLKKFAVTRDLSRHLKEHEGGPNRFTCDICGKVYKQHYVLKRHRETHEDGYVKPVYPCNLCSKTFAAKQVLQIHVNAVHLGKKTSYPCETCDKQFTTKHSLAEHQLIHNNIKPYKCNICNKSFRHESTLKTHERLHTDTTQQFTCEYCGKAFRLRSSLRIHRNIHTGDKRFECPVCQKVFTQKQSLLRHARIHTGEKPFQCEVCGSAFYDYSILRRHVTGVHKMQWKSPTQHYVLPPDSYKDGKVIDVPAAAQEVLTVPQVLSKPPVLTQEVEVSLMGQMPVVSPVYQAPPVSHTPHLLPQPTHVAHNPLTLGPRHVQTSKPSDVPQEDVKMSVMNEAQDMSSYHMNVINQNVYQPQHIPLPNALPSNLTLSTTAPPPPPPQSQAPPPQPAPPHTMASPSPHSMSPLTTMTLPQYQPQPPQPSQPTTTPLSIPGGSYSLAQHLYYQSQH